MIKHMTRDFMLITLFSLMFILTGCAMTGNKADNDSVNEEAFNNIKGEYVCSAILKDNKEIDNKSYLELYVGEIEKTPYYLAIYDAEAGNPGVEGEIVYLDEDTVKIKIIKELFEELPSDDWKTSGKYLEMKYEKSKYGIILSNNGVDASFKYVEIPNED